MVCKNVYPALWFNFRVSLNRSFERCSSLRAGVRCFDARPGEPSSCLFCSAALSFPAWIPPHKFHAAFSELRLASPLLTLYLLGQESSRLFVFSRRLFFCYSPFCTNWLRERINNFMLSDAQKSSSTNFLVLSQCICKICKQKSFQNLIFNQIWP